MSPPLDQDQLAFYDAVVQNPSAMDVLGEGKLADIARDLVKVMQRDIRTDWTVRECVRSRLRSSIRRLLAINKYPPDKAPEAIRLVMEHMESMAPRYSERRRIDRGGLTIAGLERRPLRRPVDQKGGNGGFGAGTAPTH